MFAIWSRMLVFDGTHYWAGWINVWGDWTAHITYIMNLAFRPLPLTSHPLYVGELFRYHFAADLLSALLIRTGATLIQATIIPSILFSCILVTCAYIFYRSVFGRKETGFIATALFFFNGGFGFMYYLYYVLSKNPIISQYPPLFQFTQIDAANIHIINFITDVVVPQRPFILGMPIAILLFLFFWKAFEKHSFGRLSWWAAAGTVTGILPMIHVQSYWTVLFVGVFAAGWTFISKVRILNWVVFFSTALLISLPLLLYFSSGVSSSFLRLSPLWMSNGNVLSWVRFWLNNIGVMVILIPISFLSAPKRVKLFSIPFFVLFILANIIIFQPYDWDNRKFLHYWYFMSSGLVAHAIVTRWHNATATIKAFLICIVCVAIISGFHDAFNLTAFAYQKYRLFSVDDISFAQNVRTATRSDAVFLTTNRNSWFSMLIGRQLVMGFPFWLQSYGFNTNNREREFLDMYQGSDTATKLLRKYSVSYVVIGDRERETIPDVNETFYGSRFPVFMHNADTVIYDVRAIWSQ